MHILAKYLSSKQKELLKSRQQTRVINLYQKKLEKTVTASTSLAFPDYSKVHKISFLDKTISQKRI